MSGVAFTVGVKKENCFHAVLLIWLDLLLWMCNRQLGAWRLEGCAGSDPSFFRSFEAHLWVHVLFLSLLSLKARSGGLAALSLETVWVAKVLLWLMHSLAHMSFKSSFPKVPALVLWGRLDSSQLSPRAFSVLWQKWAQDPFLNFPFWLLSGLLSAMTPCIWQGTFSSCYWKLILSLSAF